MHPLTTLNGFPNGNIIQYHSHTDEPEGEMKTRLILQPGSRGTRKLLARYGQRMVCVRYRYDERLKRRYKTVELIVDEVTWELKPPEVGHAGERPDPIRGRCVAQADQECRRPLGREKAGMADTIRKSR
jgi:hypothetical protein